MEFFSLACSFAEIICLLSILASQAVFAKVVVATCQIGVGQGKIGVNLNGTFKERDRRDIPFFPLRLIAQAKGFQRF